MNSRSLMLWTAWLLLLSITHVHSQPVPPNVWEFTKDYYDVLGEPQLSASIMGDPEYESGETSIIYIQLMNGGLISGFESENTPDPADPDEIASAQTELNLEYDATTAISIRGTLENNRGAPLRITSGLQQGGSLRSGETSQPISFHIEVFNNAPAGTYELTLNLTYQYQYDVQVEGTKDQPKIDFWYVNKNQTLPILIKVEPKADFEVENVRADLVPGEESIIFITYRNVGNETAEDSVARISVVDPFSTTDDRAFLGTLEPGDSYQAQYRIEVDSDALPKAYGINTEIKFKDEHGDTRISDVMKASVIVGEAVPLIEKLGTAGFLLVAALIAGGAGLFFYRMRNL